MNTPRLDFINTELELARTMLQIADTEMSFPANPDGAARAINHARVALETAQGLLLKLNLSETERASIEDVLFDLQAELQTRDSGKAKLGNSKIRGCLYPAAS